MNPQQIAVRFENVSKSFGSKRVMKDISFAIARGRAFCILGRSGSGKSVSLRQMIGLIKPDRGKIFVDGEEVTALDSSGLVRVRKRMGFLFQYSALFDSISVGENIAFPLRRHTTLPEEEVQGRVRERLGQVGLPDEYDSMPSDLSGGMRKRAALARALVLNPSILLVDEPSSGLDPVTSAEIDNLLLSLKQTAQTTMVIVTHNIPSARRIGDEMALLYEGRFIAQGTARDLEQSQHPLAREFMKSEGAN